MFHSCSGLTSLDVTGFNTGNVTNMYCMFYNCSKLTSLDVSGFDTGNVTNMFRMFSNCSGLTSLDVRGFDTSNVTKMGDMFKGCSGLTSLDVSEFDTGNVTTMSNMFNGCKKLTSLDVSRFDTSKVTDMSAMFSGCSGLTSLDVNRFNTWKVTNMSSMFHGCSGLISLDVSKFNTSNVTDMESMFRGCSKLTSLDVSGFDTGNVTDMESMFSSCSKLTSLDASRFDTGNVTTMYSMFNSCIGLTSLNVSGFDTSNVTTMEAMFSGCSCLTSLDVSRFDTGNVTNMQTMFYGCSGLTSLDVSGFDTSNVTTMYRMFAYCSGLTSLDVSKFDTGKVTTMQEMFYRCRGLTSLDVSGFDNGKVTNMYEMFSGCSKLQEIDIGEKFSFKGKNITSTSYQANLPTPPSATTTQKWIRDDEAYGPYTPKELRNNYTSEMAGKWIWQEKPINYTVKFLPPDNENYGGSMPDQKIKAEEAGTLNENLFYRFNYHFDHWNGSNGKTYEDKASIPANTFQVGDILTLTAVFEKNDNRLVFTEGEAEVMIRAGEKISLPNLPGGTTYQVYEETPGGWQLVEQTNAAGTIPANGAADSSFVNEYVPGTATISLIAQKTLDGRAPADGQFTFELLRGDEVVQTVSNNAAGMVTFDQLVFKQPGTFIYKIREVRGEDTSISYDSHVETITITVVDDGHGNLTATKSIGDTVPSFENETKPGTLQVSKEATGGTGEDVFTFEITLTDDYGRSIDSLNILRESD